MDPGAYQISKQVLVNLGAPPVIAGIFWLMARGWVVSVGPGDVTTLTRQKLKIEFRIVLVVLYLVVFGDALFSLLT